MSNNRNHEKSGSNKGLMTAGIIIGVLVIVLLALLLFKSCSGENVPITPVENLETTTTPTNPGITYDDGAVVGGWDEADADEIIASLNEKVEQGMINISMNTTPIFSDGISEGNLMIVNEGVNNYPQVVEIVRNDNQETIYKSGAVPVGSKIEKAKLNTDLPAGEYDCTALFYNVDPETGTYLGCAGAIINITVLE